MGVMMACGASAQSVLTPATKILIAKQNTEKRHLAKGMAPAKEKKVLTTILLEKNSDVSNETLEAKGLEIMKRRGTVVFANVPVSRLEALAEVKGVRMVDTGESVNMKNDLAREASSVVMVHDTKAAQSAAAEPLMYRGKGVYVGVIDLEFDLGHPAFRDANGNTRVKQATIFHRMEDGEPEMDETGTPILYTFDETNMDKAIELTDMDAIEGHGTHVAGTAAGSTDALADGDPAKGFYGMAPESSLLLTEPLGMTSVALLHGISEMFDKADADKRPLVVNMSVGENTARLDGSDPFNESLRELYSQYDMRGKVLCVCAGNEGYTKTPMSAQMDCTNPVKDGNWTAQKNLAWMPLGTSPNPEGPGLPEVYMSENKLSFCSKDDKKFAVEFSLIAPLTKDTLATTGILTPEMIEEAMANGGIMMGSDSGTKHLLKIVPANEMTSTNRYLLEADVTYVCDDLCAVVAVIYTKDEGVHVDATISRNDGFFLSGSSAMAAVPNNHGSLNPWAVTDNVISVGSYNTRESVAPPMPVDPDEEPEPFVVGAMSDFSSCLTSEYGSPRPDVVAPGANIISAYHHKIRDMRAIVTGASEYNGVEYLWGEMKGTSMATPAVTGIVALWLQADPTLTVADVREIIKQTSDYDEFCEADPTRTVYGKINAKKGLDYILSTTGIKDISTSANVNASAKVSAKNGRIVIEKDGRVYNIIGGRMK